MFRCLQSFASVVFRCFVALSFIVLSMTTNAFATPVACISESGLPCVADSGDVLVGGTVVPNSGNDFENILEAAIETATGVAVDLELYGKSDANPELFSFSGFNKGNSLEESTSGIWNVLAGVPISYISIKADTAFVVYAANELATGTYSTLGILTNGGRQPTVSHISFWTKETTEVPEPVTGLLLTIGTLGGILARNKKRS